MQHGQVIVGVLSLVCVIFITAALGDGRSVITAKADDGVGVGVFYDSRGKTWTDVAHVTEAAGCESHQKRGQAVKAMSILACISSSFAVIASLIGAGSEGSMFVMVNLGLQAMMFISFMTAMSVGWALVDRTYHCTALGDVKLLDLYEYNYGLFFLLTGSVASLANIGILVVTMGKGAQGGASHEPTAEEIEEKKDPEA